MQRLAGLLAVALLLSACVGGQEVAERQSSNFINMHCREHAADPYTADFAPQRFLDCYSLHVNGIVLTDSTDEHLAGLH